MSTYVLIVFVHIASAVLLLGTSVLGEPAVRAAARRATHPQELSAYLQIGHPMAALSLVSALVLLASGIYLSSVGNVWSTGWVQVAVAFWLVNGLLAALVVRPAIRRVSEEADGTSTPFVDRRLDDLRWSRGWTRGVDIMAANDAAMLYLMSVKPTLGGSLAIVLLANLVVAVGRQIMGVQQPVPADAASASES